MARANVLWLVLLMIIIVHGNRIKKRARHRAKGASHVREQSDQAIGFAPECEWSWEWEPDQTPMFDETFEEIEEHWWGTSLDPCGKCYDYDFSEYFDAKIENQTVCEEGDGDETSRLRRQRFCAWEGGKCQRKIDARKADAAQERIRAVQEKIDALRPTPSALGRQCEGKQQDKCGGPCEFVGPIGCVVASPRPQALGTGYKTTKHILSNKLNKICFFNTAVTMLFAGSNDLVPALGRILPKDNPCYSKTREMLTLIVHEMRNSEEVDEVNYVRLMMEVTKAYCGEELDKATLGKVASTEGGQASDVAKDLILPSLGLAIQEDELRFSDCEGTASMRECAAKRVKLRDGAAPGLVMLHFKVTRDTGKLPDGFRFYDDEPLELGGAKYRWWAGTGASEVHNVAWTVHPVNGTPKFTLYNDMTGVGIEEFENIEDGLATMMRNFKMKLVIFRKEG